ncbi:class I SAM-dependent methyltransferase [Kineosporia babensis]|uniref:Class I SAM-dependent methyltransferase n=1 Tax=Kineosporia babensis TaxID=499548 RepID=A0A9X1NFA7_9ACTN|nr:class I SAM-dependent methyltransferase [Kineosporia babensis]MCD5312780.1 class I SAM-dependent methyltransferase [Kineosporia babensis]
MTSFARLVGEAEAAHRDGWDFGWLDGRAEGGDPSWSYPQIARALIPGAGSLLDIDTGGGELLSALAPLPPVVYATESWAPNLPLARERLGVEVFATQARTVPLPDASIDLVLNRHGRLEALEVARLLSPGGNLVTQQVGSEDCTELNRLLGAPPAHPPGSWTLELAVAQLETAGLQVSDAREEFPEIVFHDIGAVVFQLQKVAWQIPDFSPATYAPALRELHRRGEPIVVRSHRFLIVATRP